MHVPDASLSPQTFIPAYAVMAAVWAVASRRLRRTLRTRQVPLLALGAAFSFVIMMFNVPLGATTGHAIGAVLIAILLGPWAAVIAVSLALIVQALLFGDGGITALGANCLNMAVIMPFVGWSAYRSIAGRAPTASPRHWVGGAVGGYLGILAAALGTALLLGIQPYIAHDPTGRPLYFPLNITITVPVMLGEHLLLFGFIEAIVTGLVIAYIQRAAPALLPVPAVTAPPVPGQWVRRLATGLIVLVLLTPLGLYIPARLGAGGAWGEWSAKEIEHIVGYVPQQLERLGGIWKAPLADYAFPGRHSSPLASLSLAYLLSAVLGMALLLLLVWLLRRMWSRKETDEYPPGVDV